jgi:predicted nucleic acid-binding Zn ribbon protein
MRRMGPRPMAGALDRVARQAAPQTLLAKVQGVWSQAVGPAVAGEAAPVFEREGAVAVACSSAVWAQELELLAPDLTERLNAALGGDAPGPVRSLRFRVGGVR